LIHVFGGAGSDFANNDQAMLMSQDCTPPDLPVEYACRKYIWAERSEIVAKTRKIAEVQKEIRWTPGLIRRLRGKRTLADFGELIGVTANTVWRWEDGRVTPDPARAQRLSELAARERFLHDWKLAGSILLVGDLEPASRQLADDLKQTLAHRAAKFRE
jgi:DNA-binding transcriptional regulator YiaG